MTHFPYGFFALNYHFALRAAELGDIPLAEALLKYTHLYLAFGLGRGFDPACPEWTAFLAGLPSVQNPVDWIFATYVGLTGGAQPSAPDHSFGVFSYSAWDGGRVRLHFWGGPPGVSYLRKEAAPERTAELAALAADVRKKLPGARAMVGGSWLYHIEAYRRLFPPAYLATARPEEPEPQFIALWGQFLDHRRAVKPETTRRFLDAVEQAGSLEVLLRAFPYPVLRLECPVAVFYTYYLEEREGN